MRNPLCAALLMSTVLACTNGSGVQGEEARTSEEFDAIEVGGPFQVEVIVGPSTTVKISGDDNVVPKVRTELSGSTLNIELPGRVVSKLPLKVTITTPTLVELDASGASNVTVSGLQAQSFEVELSGASEATLQGQTAALEADLSGASRLHSVELSASNVEVDTSGASSAEVTASEEIDVDASGASTVQVHGNPSKISKDTSGSSKVVLGD